MPQLLEHGDNVRREVAPTTAQKNKAQFGQANMNGVRYDA